MEPHLPRSPGTDIFSITKDPNFEIRGSLDVAFTGEIWAMAGTHSINTTGAL